MEKFKKLIGPVVMMGAYMVAGVMLVLGFAILIIKVIPTMVEDLKAKRADT